MTMYVWQILLNFGSACPGTKDHQRVAATQTTQRGAGPPTQRTGRSVYFLPRKDVCVQEHAAPCLNMHGRGGATLPKMFAQPPGNALLQRRAFAVPCSIAARNREQVLHCNIAPRQRGRPAGANKGLWTIWVRKWAAGGSSLVPVQSGSGVAAGGVAYLWAVAWRSVGPSKRARASERVSE